MPLGDHLEELRRHLIVAILGLVPFLIISFVFGRSVLEFLTIPVRKALIEAGLQPKLQATSPVEVFASYMKVALLMTILMGSWWIIIQLWRFVSPGLYRQERRFVYVLVPMSFTLTIVGTAFMYYVMLPVVLAFFINFGSTLGVGDVTATTKIADVSAEVVAAMPSIPVLDGDPPNPEVGQEWFNSHLMQRRICRAIDNDGTPIIAGTFYEAASGISQDYRLTEYIKLVLTFALGFAIGFQMPVVVLLLGWAGIIDRASLAGYRRYILMGCCLVGAFLTPADPVSMFLLAGPLYLLFELGLILLVVMPASAVASGFGRDKPEDGADNRDES
ncbi:MAG: twin-arginine translocase subunit TatC [Phycisphaerales bacterium JB061]